MPPNVEGNLRHLLRSAGSRVAEGVGVGDFQAQGMHLSLARSQIDPRPFLRERNRPEQSVLGDARVVVVNLITEVGGDRPHKEVESYEPEGAFVLLPILTDIQALHDPHVGVIDETVTCGGRRTDPAGVAAAQDRAFAGKVIDGDQAAEVTNRRRLVPRDVVVNVQQLALNFEATPRDRLGASA